VTNVTDDELFEVAKRIAQLPTGKQLEFVEQVLRNLRCAAFTDHVAFEKGLQEMAADPDIQREMRPAN
jgi:hypothetical protein